MKILKVELQNINSLKSDKPIVVDFEDKHFQDVGLYAITGPTGAGKTTLLDAITIALYNTVPRFNGSSIKSGLENVVSYGADHAFSRVVFENVDQYKVVHRYEAQWDIRLTSKTGKILAKPDEQVRLKDLTEEKILAEKKKEYAIAIDEVCQLSYDQFLRSVMLAQGEFAAFLSAKGPEKGKLLEQITGEEIYKKIGETIVSRLGKEKDILDKIKAKINTEDLLSEDERMELNKEKDSLLLEIQETKKALEIFDKVLTWYKRQKELILTKDNLEKEELELNQEKEKHKLLLLSLAEHEKAEPFKDLMNDINRINKAIVNGDEYVLKLKLELNSLSGEYGAAKEMLAKSLKNHQEKDEHFNSWIPKLEEVSVLDERIKKVEEDIKNLKTEISLLEKEISAMEQSLKRGEIAKADVISKISEVELFLSQNSKIPQIQEHLSDWISSLTHRKSLNREFVDYNSKIISHEKELLEIRNDLKNAGEQWSVENDKLMKVQSVVDELTKQIDSDNTETLYLQKDDLLKQEKMWSDAAEYIRIMDDFSLQEKAMTEDKGGIFSDLKEKKEISTSLAHKIKEATVSLEDAEKLLEFQSVIKNLEEERKKLVEGKPCPLCGSVEHPFVTKYKPLELSEADKKVQERKSLLEKLKNEDRDLAISMESLKVKIESADKNIISFKEKIAENERLLNELITDSSFREATVIVQKLKGVQEAKVVLDEKIKKAVELQNKLKQNELVLKKLHDDVHKISLEQKSLGSKEQVFMKSLEEERKSSGEKNNELQTLEENMKSNLLQFELNLPVYVETERFIKDLQLLVDNFNEKVKSLTELKHKKEQIEIAIKNLEEQEAEKNKIKDSKSASFKEMDKNVAELVLKRNGLLPINVSIADKRKMLQKEKDDAKNLYDIAQKSADSLNTSKVSKQKEIENAEKNQLENKNSLNVLTIALNEQIKESGFHSKSEIEEKLLDNETKKKAVDIQKELERKTTEIKTKIEAQKRDWDDLEKSHDFEMEHDDARKGKIETEEKNNAFVSRQGAIEEKFKLDNAIKERNKSVVGEIQKQEKVISKWKDLLDLIGGSKDAFNTYVQRLTLQNLIQLANVHLSKLNKRYALKMEETYTKGEELNFKLVDYYQTARTRYVDTSSGGEKFLISLSLALGLSDLASNNVRIDSLFIDEGFGTLDSQTLETVLSTLETLHADGKMIGIISHVESLKERIPTQIQIIRKSSGVSTLEIV